MILNNPTTPSDGFIQQVQIAYKGNSNWPASGDPKYSQYVAIANRLMADWMMDADVLWNSLFDERTYGPVAAAIQTYDMDSDVFYLSDSVQILQTTGNTHNFRVVHPNARNDDQSGIGSTGADFGLPLVYITGMAANQGSNLTMNFVEPFQTTQNGITIISPDVGGTIQVGVYTLLPDLANDTDTIMVDNPYWLVWMTAAELARNDPAKQDQVPNLVGMANQSYEKMITANQGNSFESPNGPRYVLRNIGVNWEQF
jgi:hypothetical protein